MNQMEIEKKNEEKRRNEYLRRFYGYAHYILRRSR